MSTNLQQLVPPYAAFTAHNLAAKWRGGGVVPPSLTAFSMERKYLPAFQPHPLPLFSCLSWLFFVYFPSAAISIYLGPSNGHFVCALRTVSFPVFSLCHMPTIVDPVDPLQTTIRTPPSRNPRILRAALDTQTNCQAAAHSPDLQLMDFTLFTICNRFAVKFCSDTSFIVLAGGIGFRERDITRGHNKFPDAS